MIRRLDVQSAPERVLNSKATLWAAVCGTLRTGISHAKGVVFPEWLMLRSRYTGQNGSTRTMYSGRDIFRTGKGTAMTASL